MFYIYDTSKTSYILNRIKLPEICLCIDINTMIYIRQDACGPHRGGQAGQDHCPGRRILEHEVRRDCR